MRLLILAAVLLSVITSASLAQKQVDLLVLTRQNAIEVQPAGRTATLANPVLRTAEEGIVLRVVCRPSHDCTKLSAVLPRQAGVVVNAASGATPTNASFSLGAAQMSATDTTVIQLKLDQSLLEPLIRIVVGVERTGDVPEFGTKMFACSEKFDIKVKLPEHVDLKTFVTNAIGNVVSRPSVKVDADDRVVVVTLGPSEDAGRIRIRRSSAFGLPGQIDILGSEGRVELGERHAGGQCAANFAILGDFAPGKGEVELARVDDAGAATVISTFDFGVDHLYTGAFSFGPVITGLKDRDYAIAGDSTLFESRRFKNGGRYVLAYTHFINGRRNLDSYAPDQQPQINPFIAIGTEDVFDNVMGGLAVDLFAGSVYVLAGAHGGRVNTLVTSDAVDVGKKWTAAANTLPIRKEWDWDWFGGLTVDLRAAMQMFGKVLGAGTGGQ